MSCPTTLHVHPCAFVLLRVQEYFHCRTGVVIRKDEASLVDSDDDVDTTWIQKQNEDLMDEFTDVSQDEKKFMKLWNDFMQVYPCSSYIFRKLQAHQNIRAACSADDSGCSPAQPLGLCFSGCAGIWRIFRLLRFTKMCRVHPGAPETTSRK